MKVYLLLYVDRLHRLHLEQSSDPTADRWRTFEQSWSKSHVTSCREFANFAKSNWFDSRASKIRDLKIKFILTVNKQATECSMHNLLVLDSLMFNAVIVNSQI